MNIVFLGSTDFGFRCLKLLSNMNDCNIKGVISSSEKFSISYSKTKVKNIKHTNFSSFCKERNIDHLVVDNGMKDENLFNTVQKWNPSLFVVVGWYYLIPKRWIELAPAYAMHASLLPDYSGGAPLVWAMINGESKTGITLFQMDSGVDSGPIIGQLEEKIKDNDTIATLYKRIEEKGLILLKEYIPKIIKGNIIPKNQDESKRKIYKQRSPEDGEINWNWDTKKINNFIRAQTKPYPGAFTIINGKKIIIWDANIEDVNDKKPL